MMEMTALCMNICLTHFTPLVSSHIGNVMARIAPELNRPLFQFISAVDVCLVNVLLLDRLYLIVISVEVGTLWMPRIHGIKSTRQLCGFMSAICR